MSEESNFESTEAQADYSDESSETEHNEESQGFAEESSEYDPSAEEHEGEEAGEEENEEESEARTYKLKVPQGEFEVSEEEVVKLAQMGYSAHQKWQEAAAMRKEVDQDMRTMREMIEGLKDPNEGRRILRDVGVDIRQLLEAELQDMVEEQNLTEYERRNRQAQREFEELRKEREQYEAEQRELRISQLQEQYSQQLKQEFDVAFNKYDLPRTDGVASRMAALMSDALKYNNYDMSADEAAQLVKEELRKYYGTTPAPGRKERVQKALAKKSPPKKEAKELPPLRVGNPKHFLEDLRKAGAL